MSVVIAICNNSGLAIGSDTRVSDADGQFIDVDTPKIYVKSISKKEKIYIGWVGHIGIGDALDSFKPPNLNKQAIDKYIRGTFLKALKKKIKQHSENDEIEFDLLISIKGQLYEISQLSVVKISKEYHAIGSGGVAAISCLNLLNHLNIFDKLTNKEIISATIGSISKLINNISENSIVIEVI